MNSPESNPKNPSLRQLLAAPVPVKVGALELAVRPMGWYQASEAIEALLPVFNQLPLLDAGGNDTLAKWLAVVVMHRDEISTFCARATGFDEAELRELAPGQIAELVMGVVEVNADFFVQLLPALALRAKQRLAEMSDKLAKVMGSLNAGSTTSSSA